MKIIILAGGTGKRLWPISNHDCPKQFLSLFDQKSLLQNSIDRFDEVDFVDHILISTNLQYKDLLKKQPLTSKKDLSVLFEPISRNTAPAIALSVKYLEETVGIDQKEPILVLPADHLISPIKSLISALKEASESLKGVTTFGIKPTRPETGYGYIQVKNDNNNIKPIIKFIEKPSLEIAKQIYLNPNYLWNSGMFLFNAKIFWESIDCSAQEYFDLFKKDYSFCLNNFDKLPSISFDHSVMENINNGFCKPLEITWSDIGSWDSLYDVLKKDSNQNVKIGSVVDLDTKNSLIIGKKKMITTIGLKDVICIETDDVIFIAQKGKTNDLKRLLDLIKINSLKKIS